MWVQKKNASASSTPFCGYYVVAHSGDYCQLHWANGIQCLNAFPRWCERGVWQSLHKRCSRHPDLQQVLIDSTITRAHACAAGATGSNAEAEALGRSKGGFTTKIHAITDALGNPLDFILTGGQSSDVGQATLSLVAAHAGGGGSAAWRQGLRQRCVHSCHPGGGMQAVIPPRCNRIAPRGL